MKKSVTDKQWEKWAKQDPYRGVLGVDTSSINSSKEEETTFLASGEAHIVHVLDIINRHFGGMKSMSSALDFGCGVGRLVLPLARRFPRVTGVDISPAMIEIARSRIASEKVNLSSHVDFVENLFDLETISQFDLVYNYSAY